MKEGYNFRPSEKSLDYYLTWGHVQVSLEGLDHCIFGVTPWFQTQEDTTEFERRVRRHRIGIKLDNMSLILDPFFGMEMVQTYQEYINKWWRNHDCHVDWAICPHIPEKKLEKMYQLMKSSFKKNTK